MVGLGWKQQGFGLGNLLGNLGLHLVQVSKGRLEQVRHHHLEQPSETGMMVRMVILRLNDAQVLVTLVVGIIPVAAVVAPIAVAAAKNQAIKLRNGLSAMTRAM